MGVAVDLGDVAAEQWGLVTTAQARSVGASAQTMARLTNQGALERIGHGIYRVSGAPPNALEELRAAWLALDAGRRAAERLRESPPVVVSHRSAAAVHGLGNLEADEYEFTAAERKQTRRAGVRIHRRRVAPAEWSIVDGLPVTTVIRTVEDLAAARVDGGHLAGVIRDALTVRHADPDQLAAVLRPYAHYYDAPLGDGHALVAQMLENAGVSEPIVRAVALLDRRPAAADDQASTA